MAYEVQTDVFEGPFDLLLHLILSQQVELYEISLSTIVDADGLIAFLREVFGGEEHLDARTVDIDGLLLHAELEVGEPR